MPNADIPHEISLLKDVRVNEEQEDDTEESSTSSLDDDSNNDLWIVVLVG